MSDAPSNRGIYERRPDNMPPQLIQRYPERDRQILEYLALGRKPAEIVKLMGLTSRNIVIGVRYRRGHLMPKPKECAPPQARYDLQMKCAAPKPTGNAKCQWLHGEAKDRKFCNKRAVSHRTPWCPKHYERVFTKRVKLGAETAGAMAL